MEAEGCSRQAVREAEGLEARVMAEADCTRQVAPEAAARAAAGLVAQETAASQVSQGAMAGWVAGGWEAEVRVAEDCTHQAVREATAEEAAGLEALVTAVADCILQEAQEAWGWEV